MRLCRVKAGAAPQVQYTAAMTRPNLAHFRPHVQLGSSSPVIGLTPPQSDQPGWEWQRYLAINGVEVAWIGNGCETCGYLFEQRNAPPSIAELDQLRTQLARGLFKIDDDVVELIGSLLPLGEYAVALLPFMPVRVHPGQPGDYFYEDLNLANVPGNLPGDAGFEDLDDTYPAYYRLFGRSGLSVGKDPNGLGGTRHDLLMPLTQSIASDTVATYRKTIEEGRRPVAVSLSVLDISILTFVEPHWVMAHYLIDGHHKVAAAAEAGKRIDLLAFFSLDQGKSSKADVQHFLSTY